MHADAVLHFRFAEVAQMLSPRAELRENVGHRLREQNVAGIAAIHDALRDVDAAAGDVAVGVDVRNAVDRAAVNSDAQLDVRMAAKNFRQLQRAADGGLRIAKTPAPFQTNESVGGLRAREFWGVANGVLQIVNDALLLVHVQARVGDDVHEKDMRHLQGRCRAGFGDVGHSPLSEQMRSSGLAKECLTVWVVIEE